MNPIVDDILMHYGMPRRSGRYPWGSGENPYQHEGDFLSRVDKLREEGIEYIDENGKKWTGDTAIAKSMGMTTTQFRVELRQANYDRHATLVQTAQALQEKGYNTSEIARMMGFNNESSVRSLLNSHVEDRSNAATKTAEYIKQQVDEKGMCDVGSGVALDMNIAQGTLDQALYILEKEGYNTFGARVPQATNPGKQTTLKVICPPGTPYKTNENGQKVSSAVYDYENIHSLNDYVSHDGGETYDPKWVYPKSMDSSRLQIVYGDEGGKAKDGVIEIRPGVDDLSLGNSRYAQVRILVDDDHYLKGMAMYSDELPDGVDVRFNTNKKSGTPMTEVLKEVNDDRDNPFGALLKSGVVDPDDPDSLKGGQSYYYDSNGEKQLSLINKTREEGDWSKWSDTLPAQFLSKQSNKLIKQQLDFTYDDKKSEYDEICALTNPTVKRCMLQSFADDCDKASIHLYAAALPRQSYQVLLPLSSIKDTEVYAPNYKDGETVALIRYPHGGTFEIPILTVNNKQEEGRKVLGTTPSDCIGINKSVAERLSGADFDGDTVMVIPCNSSESNVSIVSKPPLAGLKDFDPTDSYGYDYMETDSDGVKHYYRDGAEFKIMNNTQQEMGIISNLITDMTLIGASDDDLAAAVRHSMVVIDAEKHKLDYKKSEADNRIAALKKKYQSHADDNGYGGAATLVSRAKSQTSVARRQGSERVNQKGKSWYDPSLPEGALIYKTTSEPTYNVAKVNRRSDDDNATIRINTNGTVYAQPDGSTRWIKVDGKTSDLKEDARVHITVTEKARTQQSTQMAETQDAMTLVSKYKAPAELLYGDYANKMKSMANNARKEMVYTGKLQSSPSAKETYKEEVASLNASLNEALKNAPRERMAQLITSSKVDAKKQDNPDMTKDDLAKYAQETLANARVEVGAQHTTIPISDKEWEAIQAGAISDSKLTQILDHADLDRVRELATPKTTNELSQTRINRIKSYAASGYTTEQIAKALGCSTATVQKYLNE